MQHGRVRPVCSTERPPRADPRGGFRILRFQLCSGTAPIPARPFLQALWAGADTSGSSMPRAVIPYCCLQLRGPRISPQIADWHAATSPRPLTLLGLRGPVVRDRPSQPSLQRMKLGTKAKSQCIDSGARTKPPGRRFRPKLGSFRVSSGPYLSRGRIHGTKPDQRKTWPSTQVSRCAINSTWAPAASRYRAPVRLVDRWFSAQSLNSSCKTFASAAFLQKRSPVPLICLLATRSTVLVCPEPRCQNSDTSKPYSL